MARNRDLEHLHEWLKSRRVRRRWKLTVLDLETGEQFTLPNVMRRKNK